jgi:hypothetical protein
MNDVLAPSALVELYDHEKDVGQRGAAIWNDFENENVARANPIVVGIMSTKLRAFYLNVAASRGSAYAALPSRSAHPTLESH